MPKTSKRKQVNAAAAAGSDGKETVDLQMMAFLVEQLSWGVEEVSTKDLAYGTGYKSVKTKNFDVRVVNGAITLFHYATKSTDSLTPRTTPSAVSIIPRKPASDASKRDTLYVPRVSIVLRELVSGRLAAPRWHLRPLPLQTKNTGSLSRAC
jgi:hypothetical protein